MHEVIELRRMANLYRRVAKIPTSGGHRADRILLALAERLDRDAEGRELSEPSTQAAD
jgi:hypothetical protein